MLPLRVHKSLRGLVEIVRQRFTWKRAVVIALPLFGWGLAAAALDAHGRRAVVEGSWDAIVVAGCRVYPDGEPSPALRRRTERAVRLWREEKAPVIVFTGGVGRNPPSEAQVAGAVARSMGVPEEAILLEDRSTSTEENARLAATLIDARRVLVVTDSYHVFRTRRVFARYFEEVGGAGSVGTPWPRFVGSFREVVAVAYYWSKGRL